MPIYEFICGDDVCAHKTETIFWIKEREDIISCEKCGKDAHLIPSLCSNLFNKQYDMPAHGFKGNYSELQQWKKSNGYQDAGDAVGGSKETALSDSYRKALDERKKKQDIELRNKLNTVVEKTIKDF